MGKAADNSPLITAASAVADAERAIVLLRAFQDNHPDVMRICETIQTNPEIFRGKGGEPLLRIAADFLEGYVARCRVSARERARLLYPAAALKASITARTGFDTRICFASFGISASTSFVSCGS